MSLLRRRRVPVPDLRGKRCLITGAASGIGRATAFAAAAQGAQLFLTDLHEEPLARVVEEIRAAGGTADGARWCVTAGAGAAAPVERV